MPSLWSEPRLKDGRRTWLVRWRTRDGKTGGEICYSKTEAAEFQEKKRQELRRQELGLSVKARDPALTMADFAKRYLDTRRLERAPNTVAHFDEPALRSFTAACGNRLLASLGPADVEAWKIGLLKNGSPNTAAMLLRALRTALNYAVRMGHLETSPARGVTSPPAIPAGRALTSTELERLLATLPERERRAALVTLYLGLRVGEVVALDWAWIRRPLGRAWEVHIPPRATKTRRARVVPVHPAAQAVLGAPKEAGRVFPIGRSVLDGALRYSARALGLGRVRWHDFRHTWATRYMETAGDLFGLMQLGGWSSVVSVRQYQHLTKTRNESILGLDFGLVTHHGPTKG